MTDAIADWTLGGAASSGEPGDAARLLATAPWPDLERILVAARERGQMPNDDLTLLRLRPT